MGSDYIKGTHTGDSFTTYTYQYEGSDTFDVRGSRIARVDYSDDTFITYTYNANGYASSYKDQRGKIYDYTYDSNDLVETVTNPLDQTTTYTFDNLGRLTSLVGPDHLTTTYTYTDEGQIKTVTKPGNLVTTYNYNSFGWITSIVDPNSRAITYTYNDFGKKATITDWNNNVWSYQYSTRGNLTSATDPNNNIINYTYNKKGYLTKITNPLNKDMSFSYNSLGLLYTVTDQRNKVTTYTYDDLGRITTETNDDGYTWTYTYYNDSCQSCNGGVGKVETKTDGKNVTLTFEYDIMGRLKKVLYPGSEYVEYTYDNNGNRLTMKDTRINYGDETFTWEYDDLNRVTKEIYPDDEYITYSYTTGGRREEMRIPNGSLQTYSYDTRGRLSTIVHSINNKTFTYNYNSDNTINHMDYPNGITGYFTYNSLYQVSEIKVENHKEDLFYVVNYEYDDVGNKTKAEWDSDEDSTFQYVKNYAYDDIYQLTSERKMNQAETSRLYEYQYTFDDTGNRSQMKYFDGSITTTTSYTYNDGNQLTQRSIGANNYSYTYDKKGNLIKEGNVVREFKWNDDNRLIDVDNVSGGDTSAEYTYDSLGRRILRDDGSVKTMYYYDGLTVIAEKEKIGAGSWNWDRIFTVAPGEIGNILRISTKSGEYWIDKYYHYDAIGNVVMKTNSQEEIDSAFEQEAYGNVMVGSQSGYHLTTKEYDDIGELYYFWQRWYDPKIGRFISKSPKHIYEEHPYSICSNNLLKYIDYTGLSIIPNGRCDQAILIAYREAKEQRQRWGFSDKWMHCYVGCEAGRAGCPRWYVSLYALGKEFIDFIDDKADATRADYDATMWGYDSYCVDCNSLCGKEYDPELLKFK